MIEKNERYCYSGERSSRNVDTNENSGSEAIEILDNSYQIRMPQPLNTHLPI